MCKKYRPNGKHKTDNAQKAGLNKDYLHGFQYHHNTKLLRRCIAEILEEAATGGYRLDENGTDTKGGVTLRPIKALRTPRQVTKICIRCQKPFTVPAAHQERRKHCSLTCCSLDRRLFEVSTEELYALVWSRPTTEVAQLFGVSDKAIEKRCKRLGVPKPPRGYWLQIMRLQNNRAV